VTRVIVNDASCLIYLHKGRLLHTTVALPFEFVVPYPIRESELLTLTPQDWQMLDESGVETYDLEPDAVTEAFAIKAQHPGLSANDCFCLVATLRRRDSILLTGDAQLRQVAKQRKVEVHGVLWIIDQLQEQAVAGQKVLISALEIWRNDPTVFLPKGEVEMRRRRFR